MKFISRNRIHESNIQAEFYHRCKLRGLNVYLEYRYERCRFDAVMINDNNDIYAIIEFKSRKRPIKGEYKTKQMEKYSKYNIPILLCVNLENIDKTINDCITLLAI